MARRIDEMGRAGHASAASGDRFDQRSRMEGEAKTSSILVPGIKTPGDAPSMGVPQVTGESLVSTLGPAWIPAWWSVGI